MSKSIDGITKAQQNLASKAVNTARGLDQIGGAARLTKTELDAVAKSIDKGIDAFRALGQQAPRDLQRVADAVAAQQTALGKAGDTKSVTTGLVAIGTAAGTFIGNIAASAVRSLASEVVTLAQRGIALAPIVGSFQRLAATIGETGDSMLTVSRTATKGLISDLDLMQAANKAILLGLPLTANGFGDLAKTAIVLGKAMGQDAAKSVDDLTTALGRSSPLILDNLGLTVKVEAANESYAASLDKSASALTDAEKKTAFFTAAMDAARKRVADLGDIQLTLAERVGQVQVAFGNFTDSLGVAIARSSVVNGVLAQISDELTKAFGANQQQIIAGLITVVDALATTFLNFAANGLRETVAGFSFLMIEFNAAKVVILDIAQAVDLLVLGFKSLELAAKNGLNGATFGGFSDKVKQADSEADKITDRITERYKAILQAKKAEEDWAAFSKDSATRIGDAYEKVRQRIESLSKQQASPLPGISTPSGGTAKGTDQSSDGAKKYADALAELNSVGEDTSATLAGINGTVVEAVKYYLQAGVSQSTLATAFKLTDTQVKAIATSMANANKLFDAQRERATALEGAVGKLAFAYEDLPGKINIKEFATSISQLEKVEGETKKVSFAIEDLGTKYQPLTDAQKKSTDEFKKAQDASERWRKSLDDLSDAFSKLAQVSGGSFGGVVKEIGNIVTSLNLATKAADAFREAKGNPVGQGAALVSGVAAVGQATGSGSAGSRVLGGVATGAAIGSIVPGFGTAAGAVIGGGVGLIRSIFGNNPEKQINGVRQAFVDAAGGLDALNKKAVESGTNLNSLLNARNPEQYQQAIDGLSKAFEEQQRRVEAVDTSFGGLQRAVSDAGGTMPDDLRATLRSLADMNGLTEAQKKAFKDLADSAGPNLTALQARAKDFGVELDALGPAFQANDIKTKANSLFDTFADLNEAGGDTGGILSGLSDEFSDLVGEALRYGQALPIGLKPIIDNLSAAGKLVDANGNAISDLTSLKFDDTALDRGTKEMSDAIAGLTDAIGDLPANFATALAGVADAVARNPIRPRFEPLYDGVSAASGGGRVQGFASGGRVLPFLKRGTDTVPAMLTPGEIVLNAGQQRAVSNAIGGGAPVIVNNTFNGYSLESSASQRKLTRMVTAEMTRVVATQRKVGSR